jgi:hypothetical protein
MASGEKEKTRLPCRQSLRFAPWLCSAKTQPESLVGFVPPKRGRPELGWLYSAKTQRPLPDGFVPPNHAWLCFHQIVIWVCLADALAASTIDFADIFIVRFRKNRAGETSAVPVSSDTQGRWLCSAKARLPGIGGSVSPRLRHGFACWPQADLPATRRSYYRPIPHKRQGALRWRRRALSCPRNLPIRCARCGPRGRLAAADLHCAPPAHALLDGGPRKLALHPGCACYSP